MYIGSLSRGGAERVMCTLAEHLTGRGHSVVIATIFRSENEYTLPDNVKRVFTEPDPSMLPGSRPGNLKARVEYLKKTFKDEAPDVVLSFMGKNNIMALKVCTALKIPCVVSVRALPELEYYNLPMRLSARFLFPKASAVVFQTERASLFFSSSVRRKAVNIKNPIAPEFTPDLGETVSSGMRILTAGRLDENKETALIIKAFANVNKNFPGSRLTVCGDGPLREELISLTEDLGVKDFVSFAGSVPDMVPFYTDADIFVLMSDTEGMPNALIEAMSMGLACISTDCPAGAPAELMEDGRTGYLIPLKDVNALEDRLEKLLSDKEHASGMGRAASESVRKMLDKDLILKQWEDVLLKAASETH
ncbi:MAG: glycosyltransferase [Lachnospiraceae bacterium]|nr:glycosyltransferase [Lachnospiraceae bacterium]